MGSPLALTSGSIVQKTFQTMEASSPTDATVTIDNGLRVAMSAIVDLKRNQNFSFLFGSNSACLDRCERPFLTSGGVGALSTLPSVRRGNGARMLC